MIQRLFLVILVLFVGCSIESQNETSNQNIPIDLDNATEAKASEVYEDIKYVFLKNPDQYPLVRPYKFKIQKDLLGIEDEGMEQYVFFDLEGNPLFKIAGSSGGGPGEFKRTEDFQISDNQIIIKDPILSKFLFFDRKGNFINEERSRVRTSYFFRNTDTELHYSKNIREHGDYEFYRIEDDKIIKLLPSISPVKDIVYSNKDSFILDEDRNELIFQIPYSNKVAFFSLGGNLNQLVEFDFGKKYLSDEVQAKLEPEELNNLVMSENLVTGIGSFFPIGDGYIITFGSGYRYSHQVFLDKKFEVKSHFGKIINDIDRMPIKTIPWFFYEDRLGFFIPSSEFLANYLEKFEIGTKEIDNSNLHEFVSKYQNELGGDSYVLTFLKVKKSIFSI
ncbi:6-bladed beta-propeller protein [Algoriphagus aquaeductus]|uniref:6-bladed beta-propeller protein n=1 Tax=Algoriphagus aquaeductus TaxID=475299 RepID=A0A326RNY3_9BACT|nr:6-bladed beta-propeller [Algoriphagus aquaeductus]PZV77660.1 6-bladed beta-propeller protein [Algoriphagus aquaeductus]